MTLNMKEAKQLKELLRKKEEIQKPLSDSDLDEIDQGFEEVFDLAPSFLMDCRKAWSKYAKALSKMSNQNQLLANEVRRLRGLPVPLIFELFTGPFKFDDGCILDSKGNRFVDLKYPVQKDKPIDKKLQIRIGEELCETLNYWCATSTKTR